MQLTRASPGRTLGLVVGRGPVWTRHVADRPKQVLVVDDSPLIRGLVREIIEVDPDFVVVDEADDGASALLRAMKVQPDVVVLDIEMPKMDGIEVLKRLKLLSTSRVVVLSTGAQLGTEVALKARQPGAVDVIPKPCAADGPARRGRTAAAGLPGARLADRGQRGGGRMTARDRVSLRA